MILYCKNPLPNFFVAAFAVNFISAEPVMAFFAFHQRVVERIQVPGSFPNFWIHYQSSINAHHAL